MLKCSKKLHQHVKAFPAPGKHLSFQCSLWWVKVRQSVFWWMGCQRKSNVTSCLLRNGKEIGHYVEPDVTSGECRQLPLGSRAVSIQEVSGGAGVWTQARGVLPFRLVATLYFAFNTEKWGSSLGQWLHDPQQVNSTLRISAFPLNRKGKLGLSPQPCYSMNRI